MKIHIVQHVPFEEPGAISEWAKLRGHEVNMVRPYLNEALPLPTETDFLILLGGPMSVHDDEQCSWLPQEKKSLKLFLETDTIPVLGICLGAQLIASLLGAKVYNNDRKEVGWFRTTLHDRGLFAGATNLCNVFFHWHGETFELPPGTELLAYSEITKVQAFQKGARVLALQFHPEMNTHALSQLVMACGKEIDPLVPVQQSESEILSLQNEYLLESQQFLFKILDRLAHCRKPLPRPFEGAGTVSVLVATELQSLSTKDQEQAASLRNLLEEHRTALEDELGARMVFTNDETAQGARWLLGPWKCNRVLQKAKAEKAEGPELYLNRHKQLLISDGQSPEEVVETCSYLRSLPRVKDGLWKISDLTSVSEAIERIYEEVKVTSPTVARGTYDWEEISARHRDRVLSAKDPIGAMQTWLAELNDAHTWAKSFAGLGTFPYDLVVQNDRFYFYRVPEDSLAWQQGVRPGFELASEELSGWRERTAASPHQKPYAMGLRWLATPLGLERSFRARSESGAAIEWKELPTQNRWANVLKWSKLPSGNGYLRIEAWLLGQNFEQELDRAFLSLKSSPVLIVDLRANPGGNLLMAHGFRDRFLREPGIIGSLQSTTHLGMLHPKESIVASPTPDAQKRWNNRVVFLTDPLTYSASEDALLGLQGLEHVRVIGQRSGGGSGRPRALRLLNQHRLTVSTTLTYNRDGHCIEGQGIPVDKELTFSFNPQDWIEIADQLEW